MKFLIPTTMFICVFFYTQDVLAQKSINFFEGSIEELFIAAKSQNKSIFIEASTNDCTSCKKIEKEVFTSPKVYIFYNGFFVNFRLDMNSKEGVLFAQKYGIKTYPTYLYIHADGSFNHKIIDPKNSKEFIQAGKIGALNLNRLEEMKIEYKIGNRDKQFVERYLRQLWLANDSTYPPVVRMNNPNTLASDSKNDPENVALLTSNLSQKEYQLFQENKEVYFKKWGAEKVRNVELAVAYNSVGIAIKTKDYPLFYQIRNLLQTHASYTDKDAAFKVSLQFFEALKDWETYSKTACDYLPKAKIENAAFLNNIAWTFYEQIDDPKLLQQATKWAEESIQLDSQRYNNDTYTSLLNKLERTTAFEDNRN
ncbi:MAG: thioredoxin family protein [Chitinophagales bacterium]